MKIIKTTLIALAALLASCSNSEDVADAYGNFETDEVTVSAQAQGEILSFNLKEGEMLKAGEVYGLIDTTAVALQIQQLHAQYAAAASQKAQINAQLEIQKQQLENLKTEHQRIKKLKAENAATQQQFDQIDGQLKVAKKNLKSIKTRFNSLQRELETIDAQKKLLKNQLQHCHIKNPVDGIVLMKYTQAGEIAAPGKPLYKVAALDPLYLKAFVSGAQLNKIAIGEQVTVRIDDGKETYSKKPGRITWIADQAEFTPKIIQTKKERVDLVYAFKVEVANPDGVLKIGMPGEVIFN
ncbi:MAG: efflux RND transporter periplasmic adaptor subunit [Bacteroidales bacterium]|nr:efflux RND transporter periplasmic adaptor subunit [Bacteroidales bacterium]